MKLIVGIIALLTLFVLPVSAAQNPKEELSGVKREINAQKQLITKTRKVEAVVSTELRSILQNLARKESELGNLGRDLRSVESNLDKTGLEVQKVTEEANRKRMEIEKRLTSLYKAGELGALRMFFSAESFPQLAENIRYMKSVLEYDKKMYEEYNSKIEQLKRLKEELEQDAVKKNVSCQELP